MSSSNLANIEKLLKIMQRLRDPQTGCPWDVEQDFRSIAPSTIEEAYEVVDAIEREDFADLRDELGDLLFQVVFYAQMAQEAGQFDFSAIAAAIADKLLRRHPHVFPDGTLASRVDPDNRPSESFVTQQWEQIKSQERQRKGNSGLLADIPQGLPALKRAHKIQGRVADVGFDWADCKGVLTKLHEEIREMEEAITRQQQESIKDEIGDVFFTLVNLCRHLNVDAEACLRGANQKFSARFHALEAVANQHDKSLTECSAEELDAFWQRVKST